MAEERALCILKTGSAAEAAEESAKREIAAAQAAAYLANGDVNRFNEASGCVKNLNDSSIITGLRNLSDNSAGGVPTYPPVNSQHMDHQYKAPGRIYESQSFERPYYPSNEEARSNNVEGRKTCRGDSYNAPSAYLDIKFDESDCDE